ncbi:hypothetical protein TRICI_006323 [Trichomonascus ciferrii]|uniref:NADP-dependent oxidoreductase domain-containing protein n=1 Tax=Trichomonascus ciferrii TaxID=44093 RepID=A0A642UMK9_9ASCO|nr:hypothetical protein TRICI_006323 [Trichomonascus ciferrii]
MKIAAKEVNADGYGLMGLTLYDKVQSDEHKLEAMKTAVEQGANFWNTGVFYGGVGPGIDPEANLALLKKYFERYPEDFDKICLSVKGAVNISNFQPDSSKENICRDMEITFKYLPKKQLDMYTISRVDSKLGVEAAVRNVLPYIQDGSVKSYCLSEAGSESIRKAHAIYPVAAVEVEFSLFALDVVDAGVFKTCAELGIPVIAYAPLGQGMLTGKVDSNSLPENDIRKNWDRFQTEVYEKNKGLVDLISQIATKNSVTNAQVALQWVRAQSSKNKDYPEIIILPGSSNAARVKENFTHISLPDEDIKQLDDFVTSFKRAGGRYNAHADANLLQ